MSYDVNSLMFAQLSEALSEGAEIALIPPISGG